MTKSRPPIPSDAPGVQFPDGIVADHVIRQFAMAWIEDFLGLPFRTVLERWSTQGGGSADVRLFLVALLIQRNRDMSEHRAWELVHNLSHEELNDQMLDLGSVGWDLPGVQIQPYTPFQLTLKVRREEDQHGC